MAFTSFILVNTTAGPAMINIMDISFIEDNKVYLRSDPDSCFECVESFEELNEKLCAELQ